MSYAYRHRAPMSAVERAKRLAAINERIAKREAVEGFSDHKRLFRLADPESIRIAARGSLPLKTLFTRMRHACVLRAWLAKKMGWRVELHQQLQLARHYARCAQ